MGFKKAGRSMGVERPVLAKSSGEEGEKLVYMDGGAGLFSADGCCAGVVSPVVFVIKWTSTRRFLARPSLVLFDSTGLSLPSPTKYILWAGIPCCEARYWITASARRWLRS